MRETGTAVSSVDADLAKAERDGLKLALRWRRYALLVIVAFLVHGTWLSGNPTGLAIVCFALAVGFVHERSIGTRGEHWWHRYVFVIIDVAIIAGILAFVPVSSAGGVPQIMAFRSLGPVFLLPLIISALSLSPRLVLWTGGVTIVGLWSAFGFVVSGMERTLSWDDLPRGASPDVYLALTLDPDFIGVGNRMTETIAVVVLSAVIALATHRARQLVRARSEAEAQRARVARLFGRYVPAEVARKVLADEAALRPQVRYGTALYLDIENFTAFSEDREPQAVIDVLNALFERVGHIVARHDGVVVSYAGDAVLAAFNAPLPNTHHASAAVTAAREIAEAVTNEVFAGQGLGVRIGVATGDLSAGSIGASERQAYTVYGDTVNCAQRLEAANKRFKSVVMVDIVTWREALMPDGFDSVGSIEVKGRSASIEAYRMHDSIRSI